VYLNIGGLASVLPQEVTSRAEIAGISPTTTGKCVADKGATQIWTFKLPVMHDVIRHRMNLTGQ
jgi:hypothetical protein